MSIFHSFKKRGSPTGFILGFSSFFLIIATTWVLAHEGHTPLPSKGAKVDIPKGQIILSSEARSALDVQSVEIGHSAPSESILAYVTLVAPWKQHAFAVSRLPGRIVSIHAKPGQDVEKGSLLAEVESQESEILRLEIQNALSELRLAEQILTGLKDSGGAISESSLVAAESQFKQAVNSLNLAKAKWLALGFPEDSLAALIKGLMVSAPKLPIRSLVGGTVLHADISLGRVVEPGEHLFEMVDLHSIWARVGVLEKDINRVKLGQTVSLRLTTYPGETFRGTIKIVGKMLDPQTHLNEVWVEYPNPPGQPPRLLPGMSGEARIELPSPTKIQTIPSTALINDGVDRFVLVEETTAKGVSEYRKKSVVILRETPDWTEVRSPDLYPEDRVVTRGSHQMGTFFAPGLLRLGPESTETIGLKWGPVSNQAIDTIIEVPGAVDIPPDRRAALSARMPGTLLSIQADPGQVIKPGDMLAELFSLELLNLQLELLRETLASQLAQEQLKRLKSATDGISKRRMIEAETAYNQANNRRDSLTRRLQLVGLSLEEINNLVEKRTILPTLPVRASLGGTIVRFDRVIGQNIRLDEPIFEIHDLSKPLIQGFVSEQAFSQVKIGQSARIRLVSFSDQIITGKIVRSGKNFGTADRTLPVWIEPITPSTFPLRHNQMGTIALVVETANPVSAIPFTAILQEGNQHFVFVQKKDSIERRLVKIGRRDDRFVEVLDGLIAGEMIAISAVEALQTAYASVR